MVGTVASQQSVEFTGSSVQVLAVFFYTILYNIYISFITQTQDLNSQNGKYS